MNVTILSVQIETKPTARGSYQQADVAYKNNTFGGKVEGKKVMSFGATEKAFKVLAAASKDETYEVEVVKNDKGYNDWVSMSKAGAAVPVSGVAPQPAGSVGKSTPAPKSTYETPEERALKQRYIVRQSSISAAISILSIGAKAPLKTEDIIAKAKELESYVFDTKTGPTGFEDFPDVPDEFVSPEPQIS